MTKRHQHEQLTGSDSKTQLRVLCAEDDDHMASALRFVLEREGFYVERFADGEPALTRVLRDPNFFHLVVTDHQMPLLPGVLFVQKLRAAGFRGRIVVHCSQLPESIKAAYRACGVERILKMPVALAVFLEAVRAANSP